MEYCTLIMFTGSAQHAAVNFGQYDYYGYTPNAPVGLRKPPPTKKGEADYQTLLDTLPDKQTTVKAIAVSHLLSQFSRDEVGKTKQLFNARYHGEQVKLHTLLISWQFGNLVFSAKQYESNSQA